MDKSKWNIGRVLWLLREIISFVIQIKGKKKYGKNAILRGMNLQEGATTMERNNQIGGHKA